MNLKALKNDLLFVTGYIVIAMAGFLLGFAVALYVLAGQ